jgi:hypothetical protein
MRARRSAYKVLVGKPEWERPLGRPRRRWEANLKMDVQEVGFGAWSGLVWLSIGTYWDPVNAGMSIRVT